MIKIKLISAVLSAAFVLGAASAVSAADAVTGENLSGVLFAAAEKYLISDTETMKLIGYRECGDDLYEMWSYLVCDTESVYPGCCGGFEGTVMVPEFRMKDLAIGFTYVPARICGAVRSVVEYDGESVRVRTFERAEADEIPAEGLILSDIKDQSDFHNAYVETDPDTFPDGTAVYGANPDVGGNGYFTYMDGDEYQHVFVNARYDFTAVKGEEIVEPLTPVTVHFDVAGVSEDAALYRLGDDRSLERIELNVDTEESTVWAELSRFNGTFYLSGVSCYVGDVDADGYINISDATLLLQHIAGWDTDIILSVADVNGDGRVNLLDVKPLIRYAASAPVPGY